MSKTAQHLLNLAGHFEKMAVDIAQPPEFEEDWKKWKEMKDPTPKDEEGAYEKWLKDNTEEPTDEAIVVAPKVHEMFEEAPEGTVVIDDLPFAEEDVPPDLKADTYIRTAAEKKKLDPKAKVRNRGTVCVPASQAKDKKDHFPINSESQARNALARVHQYSKVPSWYNGSLKGLQDLVSRKVHSKYKGIGKDSKKSASVEALMVKYAGVPEMTKMLEHYEGTAAFLRDLAQCQFTIGGDDPNDTSAENYETNKKLHDMIMRFADEVAPIEQTMW